MAPMGLTHVTVLISGTGTNLQALIDAFPSKKLPNARISHVISNRKDAYGLVRAEQANIPTTYHNLVSYKKKHPKDEAGIVSAREEYDQDLAKIIVSHSPKPDLVVCAGWMHILSSSFITALQQANVRIINLHPALPKQFDGANAIGRAWEAFRKGEIASTGVMVHYVIGEVDRGEPIVVKEVECEGCEGLGELQSRIQRVEWDLIVEGTERVLKTIEQKSKWSAAEERGKEDALFQEREATVEWAAKVSGDIEQESKPSPMKIAANATNRSASSTRQSTTNGTGSTYSVDQAANQLQAMRVSPQPSRTTTNSSAAPVAPVPFTTEARPPPAA